MSRVLIALTCLAAIAFTGCDEEQLFGSCPLSASIEQSCSTELNNTEFTCVVAEHPFCLESVCASWKDSETFCTRVCTADADCPELSSCQTVDVNAADPLRFCVLDELLQSVEAN